VNMESSGEGSNDKDCRPPGGGPLSEPGGPRRPTAESGLVNRHGYPGPRAGSGLSRHERMRLEKLHLDCASSASSHHGNT
jgi:hypothetical protein